MSVIEEVPKIKYICDVCSSVVWCDAWTAPKGWGTSRDDHVNVFCPDCSPWSKHLQDPDPVKLKIVEDKWAAHELAEYQRINGKCEGTGYLSVGIHCYGIGCHK